MSHTFDNIDTIKAYVSHSNEAAILPHRAVAREVEDGVLAAIRLEPALRRPVAIVTPPHRPQSAAAKALIEALIEAPVKAPVEELTAADASSAQPEPTMLAAK